MKKVRSKLHPTEIGVIKTFSLSPDDEVGEIAVQCSSCTYYYNNLAELCEKWEDYEEQKVYWYIMGKDDIRFTEDEGTDFDNKHKGIGNYFETQEEAEKTMEKLKAWKRLKDAGFRFKGKKIDSTTYKHYVEFEVCSKDVILFNDDIDADLDLLFGGEE